MHAMEHVLASYCSENGLEPGEPPRRRVASHERREPVCFDSFRFRTFRKRCWFGSVRFGRFICPGSTRFRLRFSDASWLGPVRFGSFPRPVPAGSRIKRFGSAGSVWFLVPSCQDFDPQNFRSRVSHPRTVACVHLTCPLRVPISEGLEDNLKHYIMTTDRKVRPVHLLRVSLLRVLESNFPGEPL